MNVERDSDVVVKIYTDGACRGNPGIGGWGAILQSGTSERRLSGAVDLTTNNRMELTAAIKGLQALRRACRVQLVTDSKYVQQGITEWLARWKRNGWRTANKDPVKNADLWMELDDLAARHNIDWQWVRGHVGHPGNEQADRLANQAIDEHIEKRKAINASDSA